MEKLKSPFETMNSEERKIWEMMLKYDDKYFSDM